METMLLLQRKRVTWLGHIELNIGYIFYIILLKELFDFNLIC